MNYCFRVMDRNKRRSSKIIDLALMNAGLSNSETNVTLVKYLLTYQSLGNLNLPII